LQAANLYENTKVVTCFALSGEREHLFSRLVYYSSIGDSNMIQRSKLATAALGAALVSLLAACATSATAPSSKESQVIAQTQSKDRADEGETITGSRIPRKTTDRIVRRVDAVEMERERPPSPGPSFN
jgi:hypothetical protein